MRMRGSAIGQCDCEGNQLDLEGICGGECNLDSDNNGVCDYAEIFGCMYQWANNYNPEATRDDGTCESPCVGEINQNIFDWDGDYYVTIADFLAMLSVFGDLDIDTDGVWDSSDLCVDVSACNYANDPSEPCAFIDVLGICGGGCEGDSDGDDICDDVDTCVGDLDECGVCNGPGPTLAIVESISTYYDSVFLPFEDMWFVYPVDADTTFTFICTTLGCMEPVACNFDPAATLSDGSCEFLSCLGFGCTLEGACNFDEGALVNDGSCEFESCQGCQTEGACNYDATATLVGPCDFDWCAGCMDPNAFNYDEDATIPAFNLQSDGTAEDACIYAGCTFYWACNYDPTGIVNDGSCDMESCAGCQIEEACNYDPAATLSGDCTFAAEGYDCDGNCLVDSNNDGICDGIEDGNGGCTDPSNPGYDPNAAYDDGSCFEGGCLVEFACNYDLMADFMDLSTCDFNSCVGCTDAMACNYDPTATLSSPGSCTFPWNQFYDCNGECNNDADGDGICDEFEISGCMEDQAINYNPYATEDDGSCMVLTGGCVVAVACNYDPAADYYDGSCDFGCFDTIPLTDDE